MQQFAEFIGKTEEEIKSFCEEKGIPVRVTRRDKQGMIGTADFNPGRWNLSVENNIVTNINLG